MGILDPVVYFQKTLACETLQLVSPTQVVPCSFWIGLTSVGTGSPQNLLVHSSYSELLERAAKEGVAETGSFMVVDSSIQPPRSFYFLMQSPSETASSIQEKTRLVMEIVAAWKPQKIGFYLAESLLPLESQFQFLSQLFTALGQERQDRSYYYLREAEADYTRTLNLLLSVKEEVTVRGGDSFLVLH